MQDDQVEQTDEAAEATSADDTSAEDTGADTEGAGADDDVASAVDQQAAQSDGTAAEAEPEVPDDASAKIAAAQEHINKLNMDEEREAAEKAQKRL